MVKKKTKKQIMKEECYSDYERLCDLIMGKPKKEVKGMLDKKVKIKVGGYVEMSRENLDILLSHSDPYTGLLYSLHMGYVDSSNLIFDPQE